MCSQKSLTSSIQVMNSALGYLEPVVLISHSTHFFINELSLLKIRDRSLESLHSARNCGPEAKTLHQEQRRAIFMSSFTDWPDIKAPIFKSNYWLKTIWSILKSTIKWIKTKWYTILTSHNNSESFNCWLMLSLIIKTTLGDWDFLSYHYKTPDK